jgi:hypothetical protein
MNDFEKYYREEINTPYIIDKLNLFEKIKNDERLIFVKFGQGEYLCMTDHIGRNIDNDTYCTALKDALIKAFFNLLKLSKNENIYIAKWNSNNDIVKFYLALCYNEFKRDIKIPFVFYDIMNNKHVYNKDLNMFNLVQNIQNSKRYKIVVSNANNSYHKHIFKGNVFVEIPSNSWFINGYYDSIYNVISCLIKQHPYALILMSGGLGTKVITTNLFMEFKDISVIDIGSSFDILSQCKNTRDNNLIYEEVYEYYKPLLEY